MSLYRFFRPLIFRLEPERAHNLAIGFLRHFPNLANCFSLRCGYKSLHQNVCGLSFRSPVGLAAGFDKNGEAIRATSGFGFGFIEVGTVTPKAQVGNEKPRIFRLTEDGAIINRLGFNNKGAESLVKNISRLNFAKSSEVEVGKNGKMGGKIICGINIGKNKDTKNALEDYLPLMEKFYDKASYITVNISSPNTKNLRDLQDQDNLAGFLQEVRAKKYELAKRKNKETPIFLKIAPDLDFKQQENIAKIVMASKIDGLIISNTTIARPQLKSTHKNEVGGLSGKPLLEKSNEVLRNFYQLTKGKVPIIAVGGIFDANDAYLKIKLGASLVQIYSALIYNGFSMVEKINKDLDSLLKKDGFSNIGQAVGSY